VKRSAARLTYRDLKLALLSALDERGPAERKALVGEKRHAGLVDGALDRPLRQRDRVRIEEALDLLLRDGLVSTSPEEVFALTAQGREALAYSCLDPLDIALHRLDPVLVERRARAWAAVAAGTAESLTAAASAPGTIVAACLDRVEDLQTLDEVAEYAADLALALDRRIRDTLEQGQVPLPQDLADAIRVAEIVVRRTLLRDWN